MADGTNIEWTDATWNIINGCSVISPGCTNCYAMRLAGTRLKHHPSREGLTVDAKAGPVWNGMVRLHEPWLRQPLEWDKPREIFVCAHGDLFHDVVTTAELDRVFAVIALCASEGKGHIFQILTKRSANMRRYLSGLRDRARAIAEVAFDMRGVPAEQCSHIMEIIERGPLPNVWAGVSAEDQPRFDQRVADLYNTPAAVRWFSFEPLLGAIDASGPFSTGAFGWAVVGGESGIGARPMHPDWARGLRDQCAAAGVPFLFKQWGDWEAALDRERDDPDWRADYTNDYVDDGRSKWLNLAGGCGFHGERFHVMRWVGKKAAGRQLDGVTHDGRPA